MVTGEKEQNGTILFPVSLLSYRNAVNDKATINAGVSHISYLPAGTTYCEQKGAPKANKDTKPKKVKPPFHKR